DSEHGCRARHQLHHSSGSGARYRSGISAGLRLDDRVYQLAFYSVLASPMIYPTPDFCRLPQTASSGDGERHQPLHAATPSLAFIAASASSLYFRAVTTRLLNPSFSKSRLTSSSVFARNGNSTSRISHRISASP